MNEKEILAWLRQAQSHAETAWKKYGRTEHWGKFQAFKEAADYIEATVEERRAANIEALLRKPDNN